MFRPALSIPACLHLLLSFACSGSDGDSATDSSSEADADTVEPTGAAPAGAPMVVELLANTTGLSENQAIVITAIVVDPDGLDTIVNGKLLSEDGSAFYGAFGHIGGGTFQIALSWDMIGQTSKIEFMGPEQVRVFKADFFDIDGKHATRTIEVKLRCEDGGACANQCVSFKDDPNNCGMCGRVCDPNENCNDGNCSFY